MTMLNTRSQFYIGVALAGMMLTTRSHHFASIHHLPDASWAVFFLAGVYLRPAWVFPALFAGAAASDYAAITWGGVSSFCVTPAYVMLLPAYGSLWLAGRWYSRHHRDAWSTLAALAGAVALSTVAAELLSSGGFYFLSGRFVDPTLAEFAPRFVKYFPHNLISMAIYVGVAATVHAVFLRRSGRHAEASARR